MEFRILGPLEVVDGDKPLPLGTAKEQALLAVLLLHANEVVSRERLIDELWGERPPATAPKAVQVYVSQLRKALAPNGNAIATRAQGYVLEVPPERLDAARFENLATQARERIAAGELDAAATVFRQALALWRGKPLAGLEFESHARAEVERLEELRLSALMDLLDCELQLGRHEQTIGELERLVAEHPLRERLRGQLMLALYRSGRQAEALSAYRDARKSLVGELGIEPSASLQRLERAILTQDPSLETPAGIAGAEAPPAVATGTVTFLFTDIEGSTQLLKQLRDGYGAVLAQHGQLLHRVFSEHDGRVVDSSGDQFFVAFQRVKSGVLAAIAAQRALSAHAWPRGVRVRVRMGIHTGEATVAEDRYLGLGVHRAARISAASHGGQVLVSETTRNLLEDEEEELERIELRDLGERRLKDLSRPVRLYQLVAPGLNQEFPPPRVLDEPEAAPFAGREEELAARAGVARARPRHRRRLVLAAAIAALLGAAFLAVVLLRSPADTGEPRAAIALAPNSVAVLDPKTNELVARFATGASPKSIAVGAGGVWVAKEFQHTIRRIDPNTGRTTEIGLAKAPRSLAVGFGRVWVVTFETLTAVPAATLVAIDPGTNSIRRSLELRGTWTPSPNAPARATAPDVAVGAGSVWVRSSNTVWRINPAALRVTATIRLPEVAYALAVGEGGAWVVAGTRLFRIDTRSNARVAIRSGQSSSQWSLAVGAGSVWITDYSADSLRRIDPVSGETTHLATVGDGPRDVVVGGDSVWVASGRSVVRIDATTSRVVETIELGQYVGALALGDGRVWVLAGAAE